VNEWVSEWMNEWMNQSINKQWNNKQTNEGINLVKKLTVTQAVKKIHFFLNGTRSFVWICYVHPKWCHESQYRNSQMSLSSLLASTFMDLCYLILLSLCDCDGSCHCIPSNKLAKAPCCIRYFSLIKGWEVLFWIFMLQLMHLDVSMVRLINFFGMSNFFHC